MGYQGGSEVRKGEKGALESAVDPDRWSGEVTGMKEWTSLGLNYRIRRRKPGFSLMNYGYS